MVTRTIMTHHHTNQEHCFKTSLTWSYPQLSTESTMRPCSKFWIVIQVTCTHFQVAFQTADTGEDNLIDHALLNKIISTIVHLNKTQNQEFLLNEIVESKLCPKELLFNHTPLPHGQCNVSTNNLL